MLKNKLIRSSITCLAMLLLTTPTQLAFAITNYGFVPNVPNLRIPSIVSSQKAVVQNSERVRKLLMQLDQAEKICETEDNFAAARNVLNTELSFLKANNIDDRELVGSIYSRLGSLYSMEKMFLEAEQSYKLALVNLKEGTGGMSLEVALNLNNLGWSQAKQNHLSDAEVNYRKALYVFDKTTGQRSVLYAMSACNLADLYLKMGSLSSALHWYGKGSKAFDCSVGKDDPVAVLVREKYATLKTIMEKKNNIRN